MSASFIIRSVMLMAMLTIPVSSANTGSGASTQCPARCGMLQEIQILRQLVNQETLLRMKFEQEMQKLSDDLHNMQSESTRTLEEFFKSVNSTLEDNISDLWAAVSRNQVSVNGDVEVEKRKDPHITEMIATMKNLNESVLSVYTVLHKQTVKEDLIQKSIRSLNSNLFNLSRRLGDSRAEISDDREQLRRMKVEIATLRNTIGNITRSHQETPVAFSARNAKVRNPNIVFEETHVNKGNGYSNTTGLFIVPIPGIYIFHWTVASDNKMTCNTALYRNDVVIQRNLNEGATMDEDTSGSQSVIVHLSEGDTVQIRRHGTCNHIFSSFSTFSGFKL